MKGVDSRKAGDYKLSEISGCQARLKAFLVNMAK